MSEINNQPAKVTQFCDVCRQPSIQSCSKCSLIYYCGPDHERQNWENHKNHCRPFKVYQSVLGRDLRVSRTLQRGDEVLNELPILLGPKLTSITEGAFPCVGCCRKICQENYQRCPECFWPCCNSRCEGLKDELRHGLECKILKQNPVEDVDFFYQKFRFDTLIILRALFLQNNQTQWNEFLKLANHLDKRGPGSEVFGIVEEKIKYLTSLSAQEVNIITLPRISNNLIHQICGILAVNATDLPGEMEGVAVYPTASLMEHDCTPNTLQTIDEKDNFRISIRAAISLHDGDHLTTTYTNILLGTHARRENLQKKRYFSCNCNRCKDPEEFGTSFSALRCLGNDPKSPCGGIQLPVRPTEEKIKWLCNRCKIKLPNREIMKFVNQLLGGEVQRVLHQDATTEKINETLAKMLNFLHPNHYHIYSLKYALLQIHKPPNDATDDFWENRVKMCRELIEITRKIDPNNARLGLNLSILLQVLIDSKFYLLNKYFSVDEKEQFKNQISEVLRWIDEDKEILKFLNTAKSQELLQIVTNSEKQINDWMKIEGF